MSHSDYDLILIRHEEAEGNFAMVRSKFFGDDFGFTEELKRKPSDQWRLTPNGVRRAFVLRHWAEENLRLRGFGLVVSPSQRTVETASLVFPGMEFKIDNLVRGRLWGGIECCPYSVWPEYCRLHGLEQVPTGFREPFPGGEPMVEVWHRTKLFLDSLRQNTLAVTHGEVILMARMILEEISETDYPNLERNGAHVRNGHVVWYSRRGGTLLRRMYFDETDTRWQVLPARSR